MPRQDGPCRDAGVPPAVRVITERRVRNRPRPADVRGPQADRARTAARAAFLLLVPVGADAGLQGDVHTAAAGRLLPRPQRPAHRERPAARALALLDEHIPVLA